MCVNRIDSHTRTHRPHTTLLAKEVLAATYGRLGSAPVGPWYLLRAPKHQHLIITCTTNGRVGHHVNDRQRTTRERPTPPRTCSRASWTRAAREAERTVEAALFGTERRLSRAGRQAARAPAHHSHPRTPPPYYTHTHTYTHTYTQTQTHSFMYTSNPTQ